MRVLKSDDCVFVGGGNASDTNTGDFGNANDIGAHAAAMGNSSESQWGCSSGLTASQYATLANGWNTAAAAGAAVMATGVGTAPGFAVTMSALAMSGYNTYCSWSY